jgi:hypothetical protein
MCPSDPSDASVDVGRDKALIYKNGLCPRPEAALSVAVRSVFHDAGTSAARTEFRNRVFDDSGIREIRLFR